MVLGGKFLENGCWNFKLRYSKIRKINFFPYRKL